MFVIVGLIYIMLILGDVVVSFGDVFVILLKSVDYLGVGLGVF